MNARLVDRTAALPVIRETTGERIRRLRMARGWSQRKLGDEAGISFLTVFRAERDDRIFADTLDALATAFGTSMDYVWRGTAS